MMFAIELEKYILLNLAYFIRVEACKTFVLKGTRSLTKCARESQRAWILIANS